MRRALALVACGSSRAPRVPHDAAPPDASTTHVVIAGPVPVALVDSSDTIGGRGEGGCPVAETRAQLQQWLAGDADLPDDDALGSAALALLGARACPR